VWERADWIFANLVSRIERHSPEQSMLRLSGYQCYAAEAINVRSVELVDGCIRHSVIHVLHQNINPTPTLEAHADSINFIPVQFSPVHSTSKSH
jgi:hypothetical protein